jgi:hypothetical protein
VAAISLDEQVRQKFLRRIDSTQAAHVELLLAIHNKKKEASLQSLLAEQMALLMSVMWEAFINDIVIAYVTLDSKVYLRSLKGRMGLSIRDKFGVEAERAIYIAFPSALSPAKAAALLDPKKWNVTFTSAGALSAKVNEILSAAHAKKFAFSAEDSEFIDVTIALRNFLSHRSRGSREILAGAIKRIAGGSNQPFGGIFRDVGSYLKAKNQSGESRARLIGARLRVIASQL